MEDTTLAREASLDPATTTMDRTTLAKVASLGPTTTTMDYGDGWTGDGWTGPAVPVPLPEPTGWTDDWSGSSISVDDGYYYAG